MAQQVKACHYCDLGLIPTLGTFACHRYGGKGKREGGNRKGEKERDQEQGQRKAGRPVFPPGRCMRAEGCISCPSLWVFAFVFVFLKKTL